MEEGWIRLFISIAMSSLLVSIISYKWLMSKEMKEKALSIIKNKIGIIISLVKH